ncbi:MAG: hypothetical protein COB39_07505 [Marinosulfonomonas sp.]|nr:hypothetical protein [Marinosulfonomonas sp.]PHQ98804.1 MAG: hypothetical protein COB39_07505 [Marinosulfonomonas sp.]
MSLSLLVPAAQVDDANRLMRAFGRDASSDPGSTFVVELSPEGTGAATFYAAHTQDPELLEILGLDNPPKTDWALYHLTEERAQIAFNAIKCETDGFNTMLAAHGLARVEQDTRLMP